MFGEIAIPVLGGLPGVEELTLTAGGRLSNYNLEQVGTVLSGSINGVYRPVDDLTIRGSFSRAVRSPNVGDAFQGLSQNFFAVQDPCDEDSIADGGATREANCAAIAEQIGFVGFEAGVTDPEDEVTRSGFSGGNVNLEEEVSDSWTVGGVITPRWIPRLVVTVDYYNFRIDNAIATPGAQRIIDNCVDLPSIDNQFCDLVTRDPTTFEISNILNTNVNLAAFETEGVDWEVRYNFEIEEAAELLGAGAIGDVGTLSFQLFGNHLIRRTDFPDQENEDEEQNLDGFLGFPKNQFTLQSVYALENFSFSWQTFWQEGFIRDDIEEDFDANPDQTQPLTVSQRGYHNIQARYRMLDSITVYGGINNLFDNEPPLAFNGTTFGGGFYDNIGRNFYFGAQLDL
ncbi:MAG: TonB-dependent receptor [Myxococcota bacterium]